MKKEDLEIKGCRTFICPNISLIEEKGKELLLRERTIKRAKDLANEYFKKTYKNPHFSSSKHLLPSFVYIASILEGDRKFQTEISRVFNTTHSTITKWYRDILETLDLRIYNEEIRSLSKRKIKDTDIRKVKAENVYTTIHPDIDLIEEKGQILGTSPSIIKRAKDIAIKYFDRMRDSRHPSTKMLVPSLFYLAHIMENDRKTQMDIAARFNVSESNVSVWYNDIITILGIKVIYGSDKKVLRVIEDQYD